MKQILCTIAGAFLLIGLSIGQVNHSDKFRKNAILARKTQDLPAKETAKPAPAASFAKHGQASRTPLLRASLAEVRPFESKENARVTLRVHIDWGDGTGYQVLLDDDATAYGYEIPIDEHLYVEGEGSLEGLYEAFEYKIPQNATGVIADNLVIMPGQEASIEVPAGTYDACVTNPSPGSGGMPGIIYIASGPDGRLNDARLEAGKEYIFSVDWDEAGTHDNCRFHELHPYDLALMKITSPVTGPGLSAAENVEVTIENQGKQAVETFELSYSVNGGEPVREQVDETLEPGASTTYAFSAPADLSQSGQTYSIVARVHCQDDGEPGNDSVTTLVQNLAPVQPPFLCTFSQESDMDMWRILNPDNDETWAWHQDGHARIGYDMSYFNPLDDYLVTLSPIRLEAGKAYIAFDYSSLQDIYKESLAVLYGTSPNPEDMETIVSFDSIGFGNPFLTFTDTLDIEAAGNYYFAFHAFSMPDQFGIRIDNVEIGQDGYAPSPDLQIDQILLPSSACGLGDENIIQATVSNQGKAGIEQFSLSYTVNGGEAVSQSFGPLAAGEETTVSFETPADFSAEGTIYVVEVSGTIEGGVPEINTENNQAQASVTHYAPVQPPFETDFSDPQQAAGWADNQSWHWDDVNNGFVAADSLPLVSRCVALQEGKEYRFTMEYKAGTLFFGLELPESFQILYGLSGSDLSTYDTLWNEENAYEAAFVHGDVSFTCPESGDYSFAILSSGLLWIRNAIVADITDYDIRLNACRMPMARLMPAVQANVSFSATVEVENRGVEAANAVLTVLAGKDTAGSARVELPAMGDIREVGIPLSFSSLKAGDTLPLRIVASIEGHEGEDMTADNEYARTIFITADEMAYDNVTEAMFANASAHVIGSESELAVGIPFTLNQKDTLTHISIGWGEPSSENVRLSIHRWDAERQTLGDLIYEGLFSSGTETGFARYEIPGFWLEPGDYMISERSQGFILMADGSTDGYACITSTNPPIMQQGLGYPAIRAIFGSGAELKAKDAAAEEILRPQGDGLFTANQQVAVKVANRGYDSATVPVYLLVNKEILGPQTLTMAPYSTCEAVFEADMSQPSEQYILTAFTALEGDEEPSNDTVTKTVTCWGPANPYQMDFEYCADFATEGFNPAWTSLDRDGKPVNGWESFSFPVMGQACGFIAFNPDQTDPSLLASGGDAVAPRSGERYGASLYVDGANDDWLISPKLLLPGKDARMTFYVKSMTDDYGLEKYNVLVSATDAETESFVRIGQTREAPAEAWSMVEVDLDEYAGKEVHLAIQCVSEDAFMFMVDDIVISEPLANEFDGMADAGLSLYPNPAAETIRIRAEGSRIGQVAIMDMSGLIVYESAAGLDYEEFRYNVSGLQAGVYFARVQTGAGTAVLKFVVL